MTNFEYHQDNTAPMYEVSSRGWLAHEYATNRYVSLPALMDTKATDTLLQATTDVVSRRVICGDAGVSWSEQNFLPGHPAYDFFEQPDTLSFMRGIANFGELLRLESWTSAYGPGEYINPHKDGAGTVQLLVCLQAPSNPSNGGLLVVSGRELFLAPGDAIAFEATTLEHYTTPLIPTEAEPYPERTVLVGRYYME